MSFGCRRVGSVAAALLVGFACTNTTGVTVVLELSSSGCTPSCLRALRVRVTEAQQEIASRCLTDAELERALTGGDVSLPLFEAGDDTQVGLRAFTCLTTAGVCDGVELFDVSRDLPGDPPAELSFELGGSCECPACCGNGSLDTTEECDGDQYTGRTCADFGKTGDIGELRCTNCFVDKSACAGVCPDGGRDVGEACDAPDFGGLTCLDFGFDGGDLDCRGGCAVISTEMCTGGPLSPSCGDTVVNGHEYCDADGGGTSLVPFPRSCDNFGFSSANSIDLCNTNSCTGDWTSTCVMPASCSTASRCDPCDLYLGDGNVDPDCAIACAGGNGCTDVWDPVFAIWPCRRFGLVDPDCGTCGDGTIEPPQEQCEPTLQIAADENSCQLWGFQAPQDLVPDCNPHTCMFDFAPCVQ